jgi:hypothetical protein
LKEFDVYVQDKPGELAKICEMLGGHGVNIRAVASERSAHRSMIKVVTDDEATTRAALARSGIAYDVKDVLAVKMPDRPGELGKIARKLARAMVNVDSIYILNKEHGVTELAFTVSDVKKAESVLK